MNTKSLDSFVAVSQPPGFAALNSNGTMILAMRAGRSPGARFLTLNEEWATMAMRALRPNPARPRPL